MPCFTPIKLKNNDVVPCGRCAGCIQRKRNDWVIRLHHEALHAKTLFFVTLTYADEYMPMSNGIDVLDYNDLSDYWRVCRKAGFKFRYFAVGEYGEDTSRPHYHALLFFDTEIDINLFLSHWQKGITHVGTVTGASIRYVLKDMLKEVDMFEGVGRQIKPGIRLSKGIGSGYMSQRSWHRQDKENRDYTVLDGLPFALPRYYREKIYSKHERKLMSLRKKSEKDDFLSSRLNARDYVHQIELLRKEQLRIKHFKKTL